MQGDTTICAVATPPGVAVRAIVRTSGPMAIAVAEEVAGHSLRIRCATAVALPLAGATISAEVYVFAAPSSHTAENVVEYHLTGGPLVSRLLIERLHALGLHDAQPGEFTARAFLNGKISLDRAEAVQLAIAADNDADLQAAHRLRQGALADVLAGPTGQTSHLLAMAEAAIDFASEPDVTPLPHEVARRELASLHASLLVLVADQQRVTADAVPTVALVGRPNAGKSTLFNALLKRTRTVASEQAGTTRDAVAADVTINGIKMRLLDLPGIGTFSNAVDAAASDRAATLSESADVRVLVVDPADTNRQAADLVVTTKSDITQAGEFQVSAVTGDGMSTLEQRLATLAGRTSIGSALRLNARHAGLIRQAADHVADALAAVDAGDELVAFSLREALDALGEVVGVVTPDDVLGKIFSGFCVGK